MCFHYTRCERSKINLCLYKNVDVAMCQQKFDALEAIIATCPHQSGATILQDI